MAETAIGGMIRETRHAARLTLDDVAGRVGLTAGALSHIESGRRLPHPQNAVRIAEVLGVPSDVMLRALDAAHSRRREAAAFDAEPPETMANVSMREQPAARAYRQQSVDALFFQPAPAAPAASAAPDVAAESDIAPVRIQSSMSAPPPSRRDTARWSDDTAERMEALDGLASDAAQAIRTLRGLLGDEDPTVAREARRLLRELDVRLPGE